MCRLIVWCFLVFVVHLSVTRSKKIFVRQIYSIDQCGQHGDRCEQTRDCCSELICYSIQNQNLCLSPHQYQKRHNDDFIIPPYYNPKNYLYPYGSNMPPFPFYNAYGAKQSKAQQRNKMEWEHCQFHEDCGEDNCCYAHFRFRSLPKSFCRPNRNNKSDLCEPLTKYRSLKDVPAWKARLNNEEQQQSIELSNNIQ